MKYNEKMVFFEKYCPGCKYEAKEANEEPCEECISHPVNEHSHKPVKWEEEK